MNKDGFEIYSYTKALCPKCKKIVNSRIIEENDEIYLEKLCNVHGISRALICSDVQWYRESMSYVKPPQRPKDISIKDFKGCPDSCGLCPEHQQHTCLPVIEITSECNMKCPICLKNFKSTFQMSSSDYKKILERLFECEKDIHVINISGGEPTCHPELEDIIRISVEKHIMQTTVSTNGLRLLHDRALRKLFKENDILSALQFDGFSPHTYKFLRGIDLSEKKLQIIKVLEDEGIKYSLVATVVKGVNVNEITDIVEFFFQSKALSLMFQPAAFTGNADSFVTDEYRVTIPDVVKQIEKSHYVRNGDFNPLPCSHYSCFALSYYLFVKNDSYLSLKEFLGKDNYLEVIANRTLPGLDEKGYSMIKERIYDFWSAGDSNNDNEAIIQRIRQIINKINDTKFFLKKAFELGAESMKAIFIHQFMDIHTFDLSRLIKCCNHYPQVDGRLIPMCAQNIFFQ